MLFLDMCKILHMSCGLSVKNLKTHPFHKVSQTLTHDLLMAFLLDYSFKFNEIRLVLKYIRRTCACW